MTCKYELPFLLDDYNQIRTDSTALSEWPMLRFLTSAVRGSKWRSMLNGIISEIVMKSIIWLGDRESEKLKDWILVAL